MNILVTGGAGFIASHIVDAYIKKGHKVTVIDNLATGFRKNVNKEAKFYKADIRDLEALRKIFKKEQPRIINHHAAIAVVTESIKNPIPTLEVNVLGTTNLLLLGGEYNIKKFIFASTGGAIYGTGPFNAPVPETTKTNPSSPYGLSKLLAEKTIKYYANNNNFDYLIFRYANVYGPRQNPKGEAGVVAIFGALMKKNVSPTIFGDGKKTRDYVYVEDIVRANTLALAKGKDTTINIGCGEETEDQKIFNTVAKATKFKGIPSYLPHRNGEVLRIALDAKKANNTIGWKPTVKLQNGITKTIQLLYAGSA
ncbi:MAG: NAD-dependent epimerase/dehydratase family protein [Parcubacteria group bacterium]|nr:NAD-dependent epimerase/dehydratase family protein [Parcubacteria group bacterium]